MTDEIYKRNDLPMARNAKGSTKYPFAIMQVGDAKDIPDKLQNPPEHLMAEADTLANVRNHVSKWNKKHPETLFQANYKPEDQRYITIWRAK